MVLLRLVLTMLFGCLRLTAIIARTPDESDSQEDEGDEEEDEEHPDHPIPVHQGRTRILPEFLDSRLV